VFRRFAVAPDKMFQFYGDVLGLKQLQTFSVGRSQQVARFQAGKSVFKLTKRTPNRTYQPGGVEGATGLRLLTFTFSDEQAVVQRFLAHGLPAPKFSDLPGSKRRAALVTDPDGQAVELDVLPKAPQSAYDAIEIGLTVSDLDRSRAFYREFVGLEELPPVYDPLFHTMKYPFRHGSTTVSLRSFGPKLPADTGSGGIQYVVTHIDEIAALAKARHITVEQPLSELKGFSLRTIWLDDPDGITNYFAQTAQSAKAGQRAERQDGKAGPRGTAGQ
ncbi:MAG TPA: VOC family protein, partial [Gammaproteobacteria bacterium]|nr:VOC family protein [Gammaproteobacteria bacterium]